MTTYRVRGYSRGTLVNLGEFERLKDALSFIAERGKGSKKSFRIMKVETSVTFYDRLTAKQAAERLEI